MTAKKRGRKPTGLQTRSAEISCSLTPEDAEKLVAMAEGLGFGSRSEMVTAIFERLILGGWAPVAWLKLGWQIRQRAQATGFFTDDAGWFNPFERWPDLPVTDKPRPQPTMPEEELSSRETTQLLKEVRNTLQPK